MSALKHIMQQGERLDQVAFTYYGDVAKVPLLIEANPHLPIWRAYPAGTVLWVPMLAPSVHKEDLPPWLR